MLVSCQLCHFGYLPQRYKLSGIRQIGHLWMLSKNLPLYVPYRVYFSLPREFEIIFYDKNNIMRSEWKSIIEDQNFRRMLLRSTSHNDNYFFRPLSQSLRFLLFSQDLSVSRLGVRSVYAFSNASRFALESARA